MALKCKLETELEIKIPAEKYYSIFKGKAHHVPKFSCGNIKSVNVHEGDWESHGSIKIWTYNTEDGETGSFKEKVEYDDKNYSATLVGLEGPMFDIYKSFQGTYKATPKTQGITLVTLTLVYERLTENSPHPTKYLNLMINLTRDIESHILKGN